MAENLKKTLNIDGTDYNINAVYSDKAGKVANPLTVKESGTEKFKFDGSSNNQAIDYVPTAGGTFKGPVYLTGTADINDDNAVLTSGQINNRLVDLNGAPLCVWNTDNISYQMHSLKASDDQLHKLTTVVGTEGAFDSLKNYTNSLSSGLSFTNKADGKTCNLSGIGSCTDAVVRVPEYSYEGIPITYIGGQAFKNFNTAGRLSEIVIPCGITYIGASAFYGCTTLQKVVMSDSVNEIKEKAFYDCSNLEDITLGYGIKTIGIHAFHGCKKLGGISIPNGITEIADGLFFGCESLTSIIIPEGVTHIGSTAFSDCKNLSSITIPKSVVAIDEMAFINCTALETVYYSGTLDDWNNININNSQNKNQYIINASLEPNFQYPHNSNKVVGAVKVSDIVNGPYLYICRDEEEEFNSSNKMYLKLPGEDVVEISRGATRLSSNYTTDSYTYEGLAEIIARINKRLEAIGGEELKVTQTNLLRVPTIEEVNNLVPDVEVEEYFDPETIPTIQDLQHEIDLIKGAGTGNAGILSLAKIREDLDALTAEVTYELEQSPDNPVFAATSRIDILEDRLRNLTAERFEKLIKFLDAIELE